MNNRKLVCPYSGKHLTQLEAKELIEILQRFVDDGDHYVSTKSNSDKGSYNETILAMNRFAETVKSNENKLCIDKYIEINTYKVAEEKPMYEIVLVTQFDDDSIKKETLAYLSNYEFISLYELMSKIIK
ncbi:hypothetical protein LJB88_04500 [Erysipelotrichaceae bacterium OttesenSCG-928-M19]|nr:hypothetical protein [Erysipelotrichaceae bacterium OttesenSCG-928-M19]